MSSSPTIKISKLLSLFSLTLLVLAGFSACGTQATTPQGGGTVTVGASLPLKGDFSDNGLALSQAYRLWADNVNKNGGLLGKQVKIDILDDGGDPTQAGTNIETLINGHKDQLILGETISSVAIKAASTANRYGYGYITPGGVAKNIIAAENDGSITNLFGVSLPISNYLQSFISYIVSLPADQRPKTVAFIGADNPFVSQQLTLAQDQFTKDGLTQVLNQTYPEETTDYNQFGLQVVNSKADVVVLGTETPTDSGAFIKYFKQQNYNPKAIIATSGPDAGKEFIDAVGDTKTAEGIFVPNGGWYPTIKNYQNDTFTSTYVAKYGGKPDDISADVVEGYSAAQVLEQAVTKAQSFDNAKIIQTLRGNTFNSVQGAVQFDPKIGTNTIAVPFLFQWQQGHLLAVYPASQAQANPEFPKQQW